MISWVPITKVGLSPLLHLPASGRIRLFYPELLTPTLRKITPFSLRGRDKHVKDSEAASRLEAEINAEIHLGS